ncbi:hypothetical protein DAPPUDRAFT_116701 [Daphnia pulex]|uniref:M23ase beta-sheet core domain-containing protein n=1 Tax=Daphnia pulex TaxID=6669 RepID=E9HQ80_DAPPU|nr:hypothetical protein DAPPUDRAFT_116701 [Daphnia pulex]|eukprot:EFX66104.1 hypothetical protein DAPPUDRAFT_116701 [Daphnia pulex]
MADYTDGSVVKEPFPFLQKTSAGNGRGLPGITDFRKNSWHFNLIEDESRPDFIEAIYQSLLQFLSSPEMWLEIKLTEQNDWFKAQKAHLDRYGPGIRPGSRVSQGQVNGTIGTTGHFTGLHLHFELLKNGKRINPKDILQLPTLLLRVKSLEAFDHYT